MLPPSATEAEPVLIAPSITDPPADVKDTEPLATLLETVFSVETVPSKGTVIGPPEAVPPFVVTEIAPPSPVALKD
jgi:hypothetical protein